MLTGLSLNKKKNKDVQVQILHCWTYSVNRMKIKWNKGALICTSSVTVANNGVRFATVTDSLFFPDYSYIFFYITLIYSIVSSENSFQMKGSKIHLHCSWMHQVFYFMPY